jgi:hypothetical protein
LARLLNLVHQPSTLGVLMRASRLITGSLCSPQGAAIAGKLRPA